MNPHDLNLLAKRLRTHVLKMVHSARASHVGSALSICDLLAVLYGSVMNFTPKDPHHSERDRFILSKGHACTAVYAALAEVGIIPSDQLETYGQDFSILMNHISSKVPGVEFSTGSLGHGLSFGVGKALGAKIKRQSWHTFVLLSDGEMAEGSNWEALMFAAHHQLDNLTAIIDYNKQQSFGSVADTLGLEPLYSKLTAFGADVHEVDGHNHQQILDECSKRSSKKAKVIIAHTTKGKGVSFMENQTKWHYKNPNDLELDQALTELEAYA